MSSAAPAPAPVAEVPPAAGPERPAWHAAARGGLLAILDQAAVSGTNFLTVVLVGRACGEEELGYYSLGVAILVLLACAQESLITAPYTAFRERLRGRRRDEYAGRVLVQQLVLAVAAAVGLELVGLLSGGVHGDLGWVVAAVTVPSLLREFCRRLGFVHRRIGGVLALDLGIAAVQLGLLAWLASQGWLTASVAFAVVGVVCGTGAVVALLLSRADFAVRKRRVGREVGRHWRFGRWVAAGQLVGTAHGYAIHWLLALMVGPAATGTFAACLAVVMLSNPFNIAMGNLLGPRTARARAEGGRPAVRRVVFRAALFLVAAMGSFCVAVSVGGDAVLRLVYGDSFAGHTFTLTALAAVATVTSAGMAADHGLRALGRPRAAFAGSLAGFVTTTAVVVMLVPEWGTVGAAWGYLAGTAASAALRMAAFLKLSAPDRGRP